MVHEQVNLETFLSKDALTEQPAEPGPDPPEVEPVDHPLLKPGAVEGRGYQLRLAKKAQGARTLVVLPTGLGKTIVALLAAADVLQDGRGKVVFLAPTRPLVQQHAQLFGDLLLVDGQVALSGSIAPERRAEAFQRAQVVFSTPQGFRNDLAEGRIDLADVGLLVVDEAHRAVGDYAYVEIAQRFQRDRPDGALLGLTASPGGDRARVAEVVENLGTDGVESRTAESPDVAPYVKETSIRWVKVELPPPLEGLRHRVQAVVDDRAEPLRRARVLPPKPYVSRKDVLDAGNKIRGRLGRASPSQKGPLFGMLLNQGVVLQALHCLELLETQGLEPLKDYLDRLYKDDDKSRSAKAFAQDSRITDVWARIQSWTGPSHPKIDALVRILQREKTARPDSLIIVFAQYRDTIASIVRALSEAGIACEKFVGQADRAGDKGMSQDEQREALERLRAHEFDVLVASSVAEEGLDIPRVDLVVFYEPVPSEIRLIQRRGRTGRHDMGHVVVLITEDTRDEAFMYASMNREKQMRRIVNDLSD